MFPGAGYKDGYISQALLVPHSWASLRILRKSQGLNRRKRTTQDQGNTISTRTYKKYHLSYAYPSTVRYVLQRYCMYISDFPRLDHDFGFCYLYFHKRERAVLTIRIVFASPHRPPAPHALHRYKYVWQRTRARRQGEGNERAREVVSLDFQREKERRAEACSRE